MQVEKRHESRTHFLIKAKLAEMFSELGYKVEPEKVMPEGRIDVYARRDEQEIKIEIMKSNAPEWILLKVKGDLDKIPTKKTGRAIVISDTHHATLAELAKQRRQTIKTVLESIMENDPQFRKIFEVNA